MSITYTPTTNFGAKDSLPANDPAKVIKGAEFTTEYTAIQSAFALAAPSASPTITGTATFDDVSVTNGLTVDGTTLVVDDTNNRVGIGTASPTGKLTIGTGTFAAPATGTISMYGSASGAVYSAEGGHNFTNEAGSSYYLVDDTAHQFRLSGAERMRIDSSGNVGIGTSSPTAKAHILSAGTPITPNAALDDLVVQDTSGNSGVTVASSAASFGYYGFADTASSYTGGMFYDHSADSLGFNANSGVRMTIDSSGNVGIGTDTPSRKLHVEDSVGTVAQFTSTGTAGGGIALADGNSASANNQRIRAEGDDLTFTTSGSESLRIDASGNVGIGTASPSAKMHVDAGNATAYSASSADGQTAAGATIKADNRNGSNNSFSQLLLSHSTEGTVSRIVSVNAGTSTSLAFVTEGSGTPAERMRIDSSGNLLVGATAVGGGSATAGHALGLNPAGVGQYRAGKTVSGTFAMLAYYHNGNFVGGLNVSDTGVAVVPSSDARLKDNIVDAPAGNIDDLRVRSYDWKATGEHVTYGLVAQEVHEAAPQSAIYNEEEDQWGVDYASLVPLLVKEIQDLKAEVEALKNA